jgi:dynein heavy chain 1
MEAVLSPLSPEVAGTNGVSSPAFNIIDPSVIVEHLASVVSIALGATRAELESPGSLLSSANHQDTVHRCSRFATDAQVALYIQKDVEPLDGIADGPSGHGEQ